MPARAKGRQWAAVARLGPGPARRSSNSPHFACGAGAPPEVPGGGTTFGSPVLGAGFSMVGSTSFGWMTPFDWFSFSLRLSPGAELSGAAGVGSGLPGACANPEPATMVTPATNRQSREPIFIMHPLNWLMCGPFPGAWIAGYFSAKKEQVKRASVTPSSDASARPFGR
jgi:hypothetical protein